MSSVTGSEQTNGIASKGPSKNPSRLVVCFDGTGNAFLGDTSDTNIVKLYQKFDRGCDNQFHYYQPGIGTYSAGDASLNVDTWGKIKRWLSMLVDQGFGSSFDQHVIAGYRFIMRYFDTGDKVYIFGFSRGAFTARFLARMITTVGLLSKGNEEMVSFAYKAYQDYEKGVGFKSLEAQQKFMRNFQKTFCRAPFKIHFLGLFDTVNSVSTFDVPGGKKEFLPTVLGTAHHIRHAIAIDERRFKFKAALLVQDVMQAKCDTEDIKEVWFAGNHGDIGGGWPAPGDLVSNDEADDPLQLSDIPLEWMISELQNLPSESPDDRIVFNENVDVFLKNYRSKSELAYRAPMHDPLKFNGGLAHHSVMMWKVMEWLPFFKRLELIDQVWKSIYWPPNMGGTRDIPSNAVLHPSVKARMKSTATYRPDNQGFE